MKFSKCVLKKMYDGFPKVSDFEIVEEDICEDLKDNEFLYEALFVSVDPYSRFEFLAKVGEPVTGYHLSRVTKSNNEKYPPGTVLIMGSGWRNGGKSDGSDVMYLRNDIPKETDLSAGLGIFSSPGMVAQYGINYVLKPKKGETLFVSGAAGGVGTIAGQIGKIFGCRVLGSCGSDEKIKFCKSVGYDDVINYKAENLEEAMKRVAPNGIDCYFDNVGGQLSTIVIKNMNKSGRVAVCGSVSAYHDSKPAKVDSIFFDILMKLLNIQGISMFEVGHLYDELYEALKGHVREGKLKNYVYVTKGFDKLPETFIGMFQGKNLGKTIVEI